MLGNAAMGDRLARVAPSASRRLAQVVAADAGPTLRAARRLCPPSADSLLWNLTGTSNRDIDRDSWPKAQF